MMETNQYGVTVSLERYRTDMNRKTTISMETNDDSVA